MAGLGLLGAVGGTGKGLSDVGSIMMKDEMETMRQDRLNKLQGERDVKLFGQKKEMADIQHEQKQELQTEDIKSREKIANISADARKKIAADKITAEKSGGKPSTSYKKYSELKKMDYPDDWAIGVAYGGFKTTTDPRTKEMILLGPSKDQAGGFVELGRMQPSIPGKRRSPKEWQPKEKSGAGNIQPSKAKYPDGTYKTKDGRTVVIKDGKQYLQK